MTVESTNQGLYVEFDVTADNADGTIHSLVIAKDGEVIHEHVFESDDAVLTHRYNDLNLEQPLTKRLYEVYIVDCNGNRSESYSEFVTVFTLGM